MKTNRNKFLHVWQQQLAIVVPHLYFDVFLQRISQNVFSINRNLCLGRRKTKHTKSFICFRWRLFAKSSNIGIAYAQSLGFSYVCLINDDVEIFLDQIINY